MFVLTSSFSSIGVISVVTVFIVVVGSKFIFRLSSSKSLMLRFFSSLCLSMSLPFGLSSYISEGISLDCTGRSVFGGSVVVELSLYLKYVPFGGGPL